MHCMEEALLEGFKVEHLFRNSTTPEAPDLPSMLTITANNAKKSLNEQFLFCCRKMSQMFHILVQSGEQNTLKTYEESLVDVLQQVRESFFFSARHQCDAATPRRKLTAPTLPVYSFRSLTHHYRVDFCRRGIFNFSFSSSSS